MTKLLSDIDLSRSFVVASFLELEAAARSCMCHPVLNLLPPSVFECRTAIKWTYLY